MKKGLQSSMLSSTLPLTILILTFLSLAFGVNTQPCSDDFAKLANQSNISSCKRLRTLEAEFGWNYHNATNYTLIEILFGVRLNPLNEWLAWGVNPGKRAEMIGTKAIIGIKNPDGSLKINTYDITKETRSGCQLLPSRNIGLQVSNMSMEHDVVSKFYTISASLILPSSEYNITRLNHVWQVGGAAVDGEPKRHPTTLRNVDSTETIDLTSSSGRSTGQYRSILRLVHGVLNIIGWGTLLPIGVIIARYLRVFPVKWDPMWFYLHVCCQLTGFLIGTAGWVIGLILGHASRYYVFHTHRTFGIIIFTFSTIQMLAFRLKPKVTDDYRKYWNMYHHFLGYGLLTIIIINIFKGISILQGGEGWRWAYIGILALLGAITFAFEIFTWVKFLMPEKDQTKDEKTNYTEKDKPQQDATKK